MFKEVNVVKRVVSEHYFEPRIFGCADGPSLHGLLIGFIFRAGFRHRGYRELQTTTIPSSVSGAKC
jgi:hypothetical protein